MNKPEKITFQLYQAAFKLDLIKKLKQLTDQDRKDIFDEFCVYCGAVDPKCCCMRDD